MRFLTTLIFLCSLTILAQNNTKYDTYFEKGNGNQSATYQETIAYFQLLAHDFESIDMKTMGLTDSGEPLHIVTFNPDATFDFEAIQKNKAVVNILLYLQVNHWLVETYIIGKCNSGMKWGQLPHFLNLPHFI